MLQWKQMGIIVATLAVLSVGALDAVHQAEAQSAPRITIDKLKAIIGSPGVIIIDVRSPEDWQSSTRKIPGAIREDPHQARSWMFTYGKDRTLVFYCA